MAPTPVTVGLFILGMILVSAGGVWLMLRVDDSAADRQVARGGAKVEAFRESVRSAARDHGWQVEDAPARALPTTLRARRAEPEGCDFAVTGNDPRAFRADTWAMKHRNAGAAVGSSFVQHRLTMPLRTTLGRFAVTGDGNWRTMLATIPEDLVGHGRTVGGLTVYGDDTGLAGRLVALGEELKAGELWVVVAGSELTVIREGELDAAGLAGRIDLAARMAAALEA